MGNGVINSTTRKDQPKISKIMNQSKIGSTSTQRNGQKNTLESKATQKQKLIFDEKTYKNDESFQNFE